MKPEEDLHFHRGPTDVDRTIWAYRPVSTRPTLANLRVCERRDMAVMPYSSNLYTADLPPNHGISNRLTWDRPVWRHANLQVGEFRQHLPRFRAGTGRATFGPQVS